MLEKVHLGHRHQAAYPLSQCSMPPSILARRRPFAAGYIQRSSMNTAGSADMKCLLSNRRSGWIHVRALLASLMSGLYQYAVFYFFLIALSVVCIIWSTLAFIAGLIRSQNRLAPFGQISIMLFFRVFIRLMQSTGLFRCDLRALDELRCDRGLVVAPNHPSLLDAMIVISRLSHVVCVMKAEILDNPFLGGGAKLANYIRNDAPLALVKHSARAIRSGRQLLIFPEGTRTVKPPINNLKGGFAVIAKAANVPVQTVIIETNSAYLRKNWSILRKPPFPIAVRVRLGRRFTIESCAQAAIPEIESYFRHELSRSKWKSSS
jgi:1-acyl-sn-glycerol-3-phosphate acyltransferase